MGSSSRACSYSPSRTYPNTGPAWRCGATRPPGSIVTSSTVTLASFPSNFSTMSRRERSVTLAPPLSSCRASVIPPAPTAAQTANVRNVRFMADSCEVGNERIVKVVLLNGWPHPSGHRLGIVDPEDDLPPDVAGQPALERFARPGRRQDRVQRRPALASIGASRSRTNADDRLPRASLGRVEGGDSVIEGRDVADVRPQSPVARPPDDLAQLGAIGYDDEVDRQAVDGPRLGRPDDGHQRPSGPDQARGPPPDVAAEDIEHQIDSADIFQGVAMEVDELLRAEIESRLTAGSAPGADDVGAGLTCELGRHRTDYAGRTVHEDALPRLQAAVLEQPLPRGQARHHEGRALRKVNVARQRREIAGLNGYILRQRAVAIPVREAEHPPSHRQPRRSIAESGDHSGQLVSGD